MSSFAHHIAQANAAIFDRLGTDITLVRPGTEEVFAGLKGQVRLPRAGEVVREMGVVRDRPELRLPAGPVVPQKGDEVHAAHPENGVPWRWKIAAPPERPGMAAVWTAELDSLGPLSPP